MTTSRREYTAEDRLVSEEGLWGTLLTLAIFWLYLWGRQSTVGLEDYKRREAWFARYKDQVILAIVTAVITAIITTLVTILITHRY